MEAKFVRKMTVRELGVLTRCVDEIKRGIDDGTLSYPTVMTALEAVLANAKVSDAFVNRASHDSPPVGWN